MKTLFLSGILLFSGLIWAAGATAEPAPQINTPQRIELRQAAVAPFLVGRWEPHMDEAMDQTLTCPIDQICLDDPTIAPNAGITLTRLTDDYLQLRFSTHIKSRQEVAKAYGSLALDDAVDSPHTLALKLGRILEVDAVFVGVVWRFRDRGVIKEIPNSPASVAFAIYLIDTQSGRRLWRGIYSISQRSLTDNLFKAREQIKLGLKWRTANELAQFGMKEVFKNFNPQPGR